MKIPHRLRGAAAAIAVLALITAHAMLFGLFVGPRLSPMLVVVGLAGVLVLKYVRWRRQRRQR